MNNKFDVLVDKKAGDIGLTITDDNGVDGELTLSVENAWSLVILLNQAIQTLNNATTATKVITPVIKEPTVVHTHYYDIDARGSNPERVREAVLEAVGADQVRKERYSKPGFPATIKAKGLREYVEPVDAS